MKVSKWVNMGQEVEFDITAADILEALNEAFANTTDPRLSGGPTAYDVKIILNNIAKFLNALTDEHIALLAPTLRETVAKYLKGAAKRFAVKVKA